MNTKKIFCILFILATVFCFASIAAADCYSYQSTCNPYANVTSYYKSGTASYGQPSSSCNASTGTTYRGNSGTVNYNQYYQQSANSNCQQYTSNNKNCSQSSTNNTAATVYYAQGYGCATGTTSSYCPPTSGSYGSSYNPCYQSQTGTYCPPQSNSSTTPNKDQPKKDDGYYTPGTLTSQEQILTDMVNQERANRGLNMLSVDLTLVSLARQKSLDMIQNGYFAHESPTYGSAANMLSEAGYQYKSVGENIARNGSVEKAHAALMSSDGHRTNILGSQWSKVGIGIVNDFNGYPYITELFVR